MAPLESWTAEIVEKVAVCLAMGNKSLFNMLIEYKRNKREVQRLVSSDMDDMFVRPFCFTAWRGCTRVTELLLSRRFGINRYLI